MLNNEQVIIENKKSLADASEKMAKVDAELKGFA